jgi:hypothetical protein
LNERTKLATDHLASLDEGLGDSRSQQTSISSYLKLCDQLSGRSFRDVKKPDGVFIRIAFIAFGDIAANTHSAALHLISQRKIPPQLS